MRVAPAALIFLISIAECSVTVDAQIVDGGIGFNRNDRVLTWQTLNAGQYGVSDRFEVSFDSNLSTTLNLATGGGLKDRWYDSVFNSAKLTYDLSDKIDLGLTAREDWNRDSLSKFGKSVLTTNVDGAISYKPVDDLNLSLGLGQMYDKRFENEDSGANVNGTVHYNARPAENIDTSVGVTAASSSMDRSDDILRIQSSMQYQHNLGDIEIGYDRNHRVRGYFSDVDHTDVEERTRAENNVSVVFSGGSFANYRRAAAYELRMNLGDKRVQDSANDNEQSSKYKNDSKGYVKDFGFKIARGIGSRILAEWETGYVRDANTVERKIRSRTRTDTATEGKLGIGIGKADSLSIIGSIIRSRIDTPAGVTNDRDELKIESGIRYVREFRNNVKTELDFRALETHYVNINATQSIQNKWIKSFQLSPSLTYTPSPKLEWTHRVNLYANHMDYDFDSETNPRSNITRRVSAESWIKAALSDRTKILTGCMFEENDYGNLDKNDRKLPVEEGLRRFGDIRIEYVFSDWLSAAPQYIYAIRKDTDIDRKDVIRREVDQTYGIDFNFLKNGAGNYDAVLSFKRIIRKTNKYPLRIRDYININMRYTF